MNRRIVLIKGPALGDTVGRKRRFGSTSQRRSLARQVLLALFGLHRVSGCKSRVRSVSFFFIVEKRIEQLGRSVRRVAWWAARRVTVIGALILRVERSGRVRLEDQAGKVICHGGQRRRRRRDRAVGG